MEDIITILVLVVMAFSGIAGAVEKKLRKAGKIESADKAREIRDIFDMDSDEDDPWRGLDQPKSEPAAPQPVMQPVEPAAPQPSVVQPQAAPKKKIKKREPLIEDKSRKISIDKKKLIIYSEIMNPKYF